MKFKVGDEVKIIRWDRVGGQPMIDANNYIGRVAIITGFEADKMYPYDIKFRDSGKELSALETDLELINKNMNIKEAFVLALTPEPQKSFRKAGITNGDDMLTDDGAKIFLTWLLKQKQDDFKKEVVDGLLKEVKEEK